MDTRADGGNARKEGNVVSEAIKSIGLEFRWTVSRGRDTYGYNICTLYADGERVARCNGGGYDMKGTVFGDFIAKRYADRLLALRAEDMPENSHWERDESAFICRHCLMERVHKELEPVTASAPDWADKWPICSECGSEMERDNGAGQRIDDGRYFYGLRFHDPNYDPGKAQIGQDCADRTLGGADGMTVEQAEAAGKSIGLERYQAFYAASSHVPTERHTVPSIDGACGFSTVEKIARAIGLELKYVPGRRNRRDDIYILHDARAE